MNAPTAPRRDRSAAWLLGLFAVVVVASLLADRVQRAGGDVTVIDLKVPTQAGQWVTADLFKPRSATAETPAPLVFVVPGFQRTKEALRNVAIELARRGVVAIVIDPYAQGGSSSSMQTRSATTEGYGLFAFVDFVHDTDVLDYVDKSRIAATGHSAGGNAAIRAASHFGRIARQTKQPSKLHAVYVSGYVLTLTDAVLKHVRSNVGVSYALYDEGAYRNEHATEPPPEASKWAAADMRTAPEAARVVASARLPGVTVPPVDVGRYYGDAAARTLRVVHNERTLHPLQPYSFEAMENQLAYFERVFERDWQQEHGLSSNDQTWHYKELLTFASLLAAFAMLVPLARLLLQLPLFAVLVHDEPAPPPPPTGRHRLIFWSSFALSAAIAALTYVPMCEWSQHLFPSASGREQTWFFPQRMNNALMLWAASNGVVGFVLFLLARALHRRAPDAAPFVTGARVPARELARTLLLAILLFAAFFGLLAVVHWLWHVDYRFTFLGVRTFRPALLALLPMYVPAFLLFFVANSLRVNAGMRFAGRPEWRTLLLACTGNTLGLVLILCLQYGYFAAVGTVYWTDSWLYVNMLFAVVPIMFVLPILHRGFFRMTGRIWLGPLTTCLVFIMIMLSNTVCYLPL